MHPIIRHLILLLIACLAGCPANPPGPTAGSATPALRESAAAACSPRPVADTRFDRLFTRFGGGWTGADGTYSVGLPDGRTVWMFGDTFLGHVDPDRSRPADTPLIRNCFVIQQGDRLTTQHGGTTASPRALLTPRAPDEWYWPADGSVEGRTLRVFWRRFRKTGPGPWQWTWVGTDLAAFSLPGLALESVTAVDAARQVMYGSSILETGRYTYIYGTEDRESTKYAHLARSPAGRIEGRWEFFTGSGWSRDAGLSARILEGVANQYSVLVVDGGYLLLTMDNRTPFSDRLVAYRAAAASGPWKGPLAVYLAPEAGGDVVAYNAFAHPQFTVDGCLLVSYNLNSVSDFSRPYADADTYRPRFVRVNVEGLAARFEEAQ